MTYRTRRGSPPVRPSPVSGPPRPASLTARGAIFAVFAASFLGLLVASWLNWGALGDAVFFTATGLAAFYVRRGRLLPVVVSPPVLFALACVLVKTMTSSGTTSALAGTMVTLANSAPWLFAGTALTLAIALGRGLGGELSALRAQLRGGGGSLPS